MSEELVHVQRVGPCVNGQPMCEWLPIRERLAHV